MATKNQYFHTKADYDSARFLRRCTFKGPGYEVRLNHHPARTIGKALFSGRPIDVKTQGKYTPLFYVRLQKISGHPARARFRENFTGKAIWVPLKNIIGWIYSPDFSKAYVNIEKKRKEKKS